MGAREGGGAGRWGEGGTPPRVGVAVALGICPSMDSAIFAKAWPTSSAACKSASLTS